MLDNQVYIGHLVQGRRKSVIRDGKLVEILAPESEWDITLNAHEPIINMALTPLGASGKEYTGREKTRSAIIIAGKRINLYREYSQPFEYCDKIIRVSKLKIPPDLVFPVTLVNEVFREYTPAGYGGALEAARDIVTAALEARLEAQLIKGQVISKNITFEQAGGVLRGRIEAECLEKIAVSVQIPAENFAEQER